MYNCLILGAGRSGTSLIAGALAQSGYFMGDRLYKSRQSNPKGFFEDAEVNAIDEAILKPLTPWAPPQFRPRRLYRLWALTTRAPYWRVGAVLSEWLKRNHRFHG